MHQPSKRIRNIPEGTSRIVDNLVLGLVILLACYVGIQSRQLFALASIWPANPILLSFVLLRPKSHTSYTWVIAALAYVTADLTTGAPLHMALILNGANMLGVVIGALVARALAPEQFTLARPDDAIILIFIMICASMGTAVIGAAVGPLYFGMEPSHSFMVWLAAELVNHAMYIPVLLSAFLGDNRRLRVFSLNTNQRNNQLAALGCAVLLVGFMYLMGGPGSPTYVIPGIIWCAIVFRVFATTAIGAAIMSLILITGPSA